MVPKVSPENAELNLSANLSSALPTFTVSGLDPGSKYVGELVGHNVKGMFDFVFDRELSFTCGSRNSFYVIGPANFFLYRDSGLHQGSKYVDEIVGHNVKAAIFHKNLTF